VPLGRTWQVVAGSAAIGVVVAAGTAAAAGPWQDGQRTAERHYAAARDTSGAGAGAHRTAPDSAPSGGTSATAAGGTPAAAPGPTDTTATALPVLVPLSGTAAGTKAPLPTGLGKRLDPLLSAYGMGSVSTGAVVDASSGTVLYDHDDGSATTPASTTKLATSAAALGLLGPDARLTTKAVVTGGAKGTRQVVLVGGGDPTLRLGQLAEDTAKALKARGTSKVSLGYDTSLFTGPVLHPIGVNDNLAPVTALMSDEARLDASASGPAPRAADPAGSAATAFAQLLRDHGITVTGSARQASGKGGSTLATHSSEPLSDLVEEMLTTSDNDLAEALARQVALASGQPASFDGGAKAVRAALVRYGVPLPHASFHDGSGLDHDDRLAPLTLARLLALAASPAHPELRPILSGLPVADFTGTLTARFHGSPAAGLVRAKTGTLTGTNTIAGTVVTSEGRLLTFSFMTQGGYDPAATEAALDHLATAVAGA
jgi:D-alanyl-D-alanine carboxypeptidase/D-alanyl-D-alanine-endopeptidase (penicillin-binding protein 4)